MIIKTCLRLRHRSTISNCKNCLWGVGWLRQARRAWFLAACLSPLEKMAAGLLIIHGREQDVPFVLEGESTAIFLPKSSEIKIVRMYGLRFRVHTKSFMFNPRKYLIRFHKFQSSLEKS